MLAKNKNFIEFENFGDTKRDIYDELIITGISFISYNQCLKITSSN